MSDANKWRGHWMIWAIRGAFVLALVVITALSLLPSGYLLPQDFNFWDKGQHVTAYAVLAILGAGGFSDRRMTVIIGLLVHGMLIESWQYQLGWRQGDVMDWVADGVGVMIGFLVIRGIVLLRLRMVPE